MAAASSERRTEARAFSVAGKLKAATKRIIRRVTGGAPFPGSRTYWESRYAAGGTSGDGSYGLLAQFKAEVLNSFVAEHQVDTVIEFGCGDGNQLSLAEYPKYIGLDVARDAIKVCSMRFREDASKSFFLYDPECFVDRCGVFAADLAISLDVVYHLVEDSVYSAYMRHLFGAARRYVIVYSSNSDSLRSKSPHVRHRAFSHFVESDLAPWRLVSIVRNRYPYEESANTGSFADFYIFGRSVT